MWLNCHFWVCLSRHALLFSEIELALLAAAGESSHGLMSPLSSDWLPASDCSSFSLASACSSQDHVTEPANGTPRSGRRRGVVELQTEMLHLDLIDAEGGIQEEEEEEENERPLDPVDDNHKEEQGAGLPVIQPKLKDFIPPVAMDTYRPKRPTTLNLFPQVPRTQVSERF